MTFDTLPSDKDLLDMLTAAKLYDGKTDGGLFYELLGYVDSAIDEFQSQSGRKPILIDLAPVTRRYDPPGDRASRFDVAKRPFVRTGGCQPNPNAIYTHETFGGATFLLFDNGLFECSEVATEISPQNPAGLVRTAGQDFQFFPYNAPAMNEPWTGIEFNRPVWGLKASVTVTGLWGLGRTCPAYVWKGILALAAYMAAPIIEQSITKAQISFQDKTQKVQYDNDPVTGTAAKWKRIADDAIEDAKTTQRKFGR